MDENNLSVTDIIRRDIMSYIWDDDEIPCARTLQEIFTTLDRIDEMFEKRDDELKVQKRAYLELRVEFNRLKKKLDAYEEST